MKFLVRRIVSWYLVICFLCLQVPPLVFAEACGHRSYYDDYNGKSHYTGSYDEEEHEVTDYYNRICSDCGEFLQEVTGNKWLSHVFDGNTCGCGYTKPEKVCQHWNYSDHYNEKSYYTGSYTEESHEVTDYYDRTCNDCGQFMVEVKENKWLSHEFYGNTCGCGYVKSEEVCEHRNYSDHYNGMSCYTESYNEQEHEVMDYYNRNCSNCGEFLEEVTKNKWLPHEFYGNFCDCGYTKPQEACTHSSYEDYFNGKLYYTGIYNETQHEAEAWDNRYCNSCGELIEEVSRKEWHDHYYIGNACSCGYTKPEETCEHSSYEDYFNGNIYYTGIYNETQHEYEMWDTRYCKTCQEMLGEISQKEWENHYYIGNFCGCGYTKPQENETKCSHGNVQYIYADYSEYTGSFDPNGHNIIDYYNLCCNLCQEIVEQNVPGYRWEAHTFSGNQCGCGYTTEVSKEEAHECSRVREYAQPRYTYNDDNTHEVYVRWWETCHCGNYFGEQTSISYEEHQFTGQTCTLCNCNKSQQTTQETPAPTPEAPRGTILNFPWDKHYTVRQEATFQVDFNSNAKDVYIQFLNPTQNDWFEEPSAFQLQVDLTTKQAKGVIERCGYYDCYIYVVNEDGRILKQYVETITVDRSKRSVLPTTLSLDYWQGAWQSVVDNLNGLGYLVELGVDNSVTMQSNIANLFTGNFEAIKEPEVVAILEFYSKAIFNGNSEERKILQETFQETVAELNTKTSNATQKEMEWAAGYVSAEVLITLALSKGITKVADSVADAGKVGSVVLNNADDLSKASLQAASKSVIGSVDDVGKVASKMDDLYKGLKGTENFSDDLVEHLFSGQVKKGKAKGFHYEGVGDAKGKVVQVTKPENSYGVYEAWVEVNGKGKLSTFFPKGWTPQQIVDAIADAFMNRKLDANHLSRYTGELKNGMKIQMYIENGVITSAFPLY